MYKRIVVNGSILYTLWRDDYWRQWSWWCKLERSGKCQDLMSPLSWRLCRHRRCVVAFVHLVPRKLPQSTENIEHTRTHTSSNHHHHLFENTVGCSNASVAANTPSVLSILPGPDLNPIRPCSVNFLALV